MALREKNRNGMRNINFWIHGDVITEILALQAALWPYQRASKTGILRQCLEMGIVMLKADLSRMEKLRTEEAVQS